MVVKKNGKKKEVLPDPNELPDGKFNYYIRSWSSYTSIKSLSKISHDLVAACTAPNREVGAIPRTNVLILPIDSSTHPNHTNHTKDNDNDNEEEKEEEGKGEGEGEEGSLTVVVELADQLRVEGIPRQLMKEKAGLIRSWQPVDPTHALPSASVEGEPSNAGGSVGPPSEVDGETGLGPGQLESTVRGYDNVLDLPSPEPDRVLAALQQIDIPCGAQFSSLDNCIDGDLHILGVEPSIVVHPDVVLETVEEEKVVLSKRRSLQGKNKRGKKSKLTPEQLAELERQKAEAQALREQQVQESLERARRKEEFLNTFSHPDRWAQVTISGLTFTGNICVSRAHVTFQNCRFMAQTSKGDAYDPQLSVFPYSVVNLIKCTFETPAHCCLYAFPCSQVSVKKCLFSGLPHQELAADECKVRLDDSKGIPSLDIAEVTSSKSNDEFIQRFATRPSKELEVGEQPLSQELMERYNALRENNMHLVGVHVDSARILIEACRFAFLGTGVLFCGHCVISELPPLSVAGSEFKSPAAMTMLNSRLHHMYSTAVRIEALNVLLKGNEIHDCEHYGLDCHAKCINVSVLRNRFGIHATVRIRKGIRIKLLNNALHETLVDDNIYDNPCLEPAY